MEQDKEFLKAKNYTFKLLSYRQKSTKEIKDRLKMKGFIPATIKKTIKYLNKLNYLNDEDFTRFWIQAKIQSRPVGWLLLRYQLRQKGIPEQIMEEVISDFAGQYDEYEAAKKLATSRRNRYKDLEPLKLKRRLYDYLRQRGFSQEAILQAIK